MGKRTPAGYKRRKVAPGVVTLTQKRPMERYEVGAPWLTFRYAWSDRWTRVLGRGRVHYLCLICGKRDRFTFRIPRFGKVPEPPGGIHPLRHGIKARHSHPGERGNPMLWARPLGNLAAFRGREAGLVDVIEERVVKPLSVPKDSSREGASDG